MSEQFLPRPAAPLLTPFLGEHYYGFDVVPFAQRKVGEVQLPVDLDDRMDPDAVHDERS